jgi:hypothetical protein
MDIGNCGEVYQWEGRGRKERRLRGEEDGRHYTHTYKDSVMKPTRH